MVEKVFNELDKCRLCPHECSINRNNNELGRCKSNNRIKIALISLHYFEEPCISGEEGSGTIFFSSCNLSCKFCQNFEISQEERIGKYYTIKQLSDSFLELQSKGANNINLVTGFMYIPQIIETIKMSKEKGLKIPIIYNTSGYESTEALKLLDGYVDCYLPDFKYYDDELALRLSGIKNYSLITKNAINEMYRQVGSPQIDNKDKIKKGMIIRHLVLPNHLDDSKKILKWIKSNYPDCLVSVMTQYFPSNKALNIEDISRKLNEQEYNEIEDYVFELDLNGFMQDLEENEEQYVPNFKQ